MYKTPMGKCFIASALAILSLFCLGCSTSDSKPSSQLAINIKESPRSLDPREVRLLSDMSLVKHLYEGLVQENPRTGDIELAIAQSYTVSDDGKTYTFHLKPTYWSNGDPLTADDFIQSWLDIATNKVQSIYAFALNPIVNVPQVREGSVSADMIGLSQLDERTLQIRLQAPLNYFLKLLALPIFYPVHHSQRTPSLHTTLISNGAFTLHPTENKNHLLLKKNPYYYEKDRVQMEAIKVFCIPDAHTAALFFNRNIIHWQGPPWGKQIPKEILHQLKTSGELQTADVAGTSWLTFNVHCEPFNHQKLRKALAYAINLEDLSAGLSLHAIKPAYHLFPSPIFNVAGAEEPQESRIHMAQQLFQEALEELHLSPKDLEKHPILFSNASQINALLAQLIQKQWKDTLGFTAPMISKESALIQSDLTHKQFSLAISGWFADFLDPMTFLSIFSYPSGLPTYAIKDPTFMHLLRKIQEEPIAEQRLQWISEASAYLEQQCIIQPLYYEVFQFAKHKCLVDFHLSPTGIADLRYARMHS